MELNNWPFFRFQLLGVRGSQLDVFFHAIPGLGPHNLSNENGDPSCLGYFSDEILHRYMGITS